MKTFDSIVYLKSGSNLSGEIFATNKEKLAEIVTEKKSLLFNNVIIPTRNIDFIQFKEVN